MVETVAISRYASGARDIGFQNEKSEKVFCERKRTIPKGKWDLYLSKLS